MVFSTSELASTNEIKKVDELMFKLGAFKCVVREAKKAWYKSGTEEIWVWRTSGGAKHSVPLETLSPTVKGLIEVNQRRLYVPEHHRPDAERLISTMIKN